jgi:biopolymer transport protein ExbD
MTHTNSRRSTTLFVLTVAATVLFAPISSHAQEMQRGVSVQMPVTSNATSVPDADHNDAWVVAVTADGSLYFGVDPMTREGLADWMRPTLAIAKPSSTSKPTPVRYSAPWRKCSRSRVKTFFKTRSC